MEIFKDIAQSLYEGIQYPLISWTKGTSAHTTYMFFHCKNNPRLFFM